MKTNRRLASACNASLFLLLFSFQTASVRAQSEASLAKRIEKITSRPEFVHANFGIEFYSLETGKVLYSLNADKLFVPASTTKILTEGTLLAKLGPDYRFHTRVYRTGLIDKRGVLKGDLILVASGDPNLSNRIQPDGTLAFVDHDHSYNGPALSGDPLTVIKQLARDVAAKGIRKIEGRVYVDATLLPEVGREGGTDVLMSSIMVNDNVIDLVGIPGAKAGDPVKLSVSPQTSYLHFTNTLTTGPSDSKPAFDSSSPAANADGSFTVTLTGSTPPVPPPMQMGPSPSRSRETFRLAANLRPRLSPFLHPSNSPPLYSVKPSSPREFP